MYTPAGFSGGALGSMRLLAFSAGGPCRAQPKACASYKTIERGQAVSEDCRLPKSDSSSCSKLAYRWTGRNARWPHLCSRLPRRCCLLSEGPFLLLQVPSKVLSPRGAAFAQGFAGLKEFQTCRTPDRIPMPWCRQGASGHACSWRASTASSVALCVWVCSGLSGSCSRPCSSAGGGWCTVQGVGLDSDDCPRPAM